ncbi:protein arginine kinase [Clostridium sp.]|uniref:protein arginine kinase n=1 Tax=Clostridium sp. TaxID=1506 RepID=UPI002630E1E1|nr:protein arginine kinase [Clostridium sp.]
MVKWVNPQNNRDIIIASKVKIFRNIKGFKFASLLKEEECKEIINKVLRVLDESSISENIYRVNIKCDYELVDYEKESFGISKDFLSSDNTALIMSKNEEFNILLNEEEHIGIESTKSGLDLRGAFKVVNELDDLLDGKFEYSFDDEFGYLTSNIKNLGTALIGKVILHLPALNLSGSMRDIKENLSEFGINIRSMYRLGSRDIGNIYNISNVKTIGLSEEDILDSLLSIANKLVINEKRERDKLLDEGEVELKDTIYRALGTLKNAYIIDISEGLKLLSYVRLGIELGIINDISLKAVNEAMINIQPSIINKTLKTKLNIQNIKLERAKIIRNALNT